MTTQHAVYRYRVGVDHKGRAGRAAAKCLCGAVLLGEEAIREHEVLAVWDPYADGTSGHQGDASQDAEPHRRSRMPWVLQQVADAGPRGVTSLELERKSGSGHGAISSALSNLHRSKAVTKLTERRERYGVYVLPKHVGDRETVPFRPNF